jgi:hypothetical protein
LVHPGLDAVAIVERNAAAALLHVNGRHWIDRDVRDHHDASGGCSREPTLNCGVTPEASSRMCPFDVLRIGVRGRVSSHSTPAQVGSIEAVSNEVAVDKKLSRTPVRMRLGGIARAAPATKQLSNNADPPSGSPARSWLDTCLVVRGLDGCPREVSKLHCQKVETPACLLKKRPELRRSAGSYTESLLSDPGPAQEDLRQPHPIRRASLWSDTIAQE